MSFSSLRLDPGQERLWRGREEIVLRPKAFALLCHLLRRSGRWTTTEELLEAGWPSTHVSHVGVKVCIAEIRRALGERPGASLIETRRGRGYRLAAPVTMLASHKVARPDEGRLVFDGPPSVLRDRAGATGAIASGQR